MGQLSGLDAAGMAAVQQSLANMVAAAQQATMPATQPLQQRASDAPEASNATPVVDKAKIVEGDSQPPVPSTPSPATPIPSVNPPTPSTNPPMLETPSPASDPCSTLALPKAGYSGPINSSTHKTEYRSFQRFCENSPGAEELKKCWVQGGPKRLAMFQKFVATGCNPLALECALRFRRQREEEDKDEGEYYPWKDILSFHEGNRDKALQFVSKRRAEPHGTSTDRNDATIDDIAISMGCSPSYAATVASQLDNMNGALSIPGTGGSGAAGSQEDSENPPPPAPAAGNSGGNPKNKAKNGSPAGNTKSDQPLKKARSVRPEARTMTDRSDSVHVPLHVCPAQSTTMTAMQGSDLELTISTDDVGLFVKSWVAAANTAQGQAVKMSAELEALDSQEALMGKLKDCADGIGACRKKLQALGTAPVASDVQTALME
ncbi:unnamed protein product, partial [Symbiodinium sp. CCMP2456]